MSSTHKIPGKPPGQDGNLLSNKINAQRYTIDVTSLEMGGNALRTPKG
jgi:hypothetical protein